MSPPGCQCVPEVSGKFSKSDQKRRVNKLRLLLERMHVGGFSIICLSVIDDPFYFTSIINICLFLCFLIFSSIYAKLLSKARLTLSSPSLSQISREEAERNRECNM